MLKIIDSKNCKNNLVFLKVDSHTCDLIIDDKEVLYLKIGNIVVNKFDKNVDNSLFEGLNNHEYRKINGIFEYDKTYLHYASTIDGYSLHKHYFFTANEGKDTIYLYDSLPIDDRYMKEKVQILSRDEIEEIFDSSNYDSFYLANDTVIYYAKNKKDGILKNKKIIPSDEEIIELELKNRKSNQMIANLLIDSSDFEELNSKTIDEIENFKLYYPLLLSRYVDMLITSKDGKFDIKYFKLKFLKRDKFELTTSDIPIIDPIQRIEENIEDVKTKKLILGK